jgi:hypothetical protein
MDSELLQAALAGLERSWDDLAEKISEVRRETWFSRIGRECAADSEETECGCAQAHGEAQRKRWAAVKGESTAAPGKKTAGPTNRRISAAGRKRMSEATKKRWAEYRAKNTGAKRAASQ